MRIIKDNYTVHKRNISCPTCESEMEIVWKDDWRNYKLFELREETNGFSCPLCRNKIPCPIEDVPPAFRKLITGESQSE